MTDEDNNPRMDWRRSLADDMALMMDRSSIIRQDVHNRLYPLASSRIEDVLNEPINDKNIATIANTALRVLEFNKTPPPSMSFSAVSQQINHANNDATYRVIEAVELTEAQLMFATQAAMKAQLQIAEWREEQVENSATIFTQTNDTTSKNIPEK